MSGGLASIIRCDSCDVLFHGVFGERLLRDVRARAKGAGWEHHLVLVRYGAAPSLDFCIKCVETGRSKNAVDGITALLGGKADATPQGVSELPGTDSSSQRV